MTDKSGVICVYKEVGETPLEAISKIKTTEKLSYIGRLDPLADGLMLVLVGEENKNREAYLDLPKTYRFEFVSGFKTDTYDVLGLANICEVTEHKKIETGKRTQKYPPYSSKPVDGKPLFQWAREGKKVEAPEREIEIFESKIIDERNIGAKELKEIIVDKINLVKGDFRQKEIIQRWNELLKEGEYKIIKGEISCSSGTYVRSLVNESGCFTTLSITRTKFGDYIVGSECSSAVD